MHEPITPFQKKPFVLSLGGSLVVPNGGPDTAFLKKLRRFVQVQVRSGRKLAIVVGGGKTARHYIDSAEKVKSIESEDLDWLGIHSTRLNAHLLRTILRDIAHPVVIKDPTKTPKRWNGKVLIAAGWKPGWSTDYVACRIAQNIGTDTVLNLSNIEKVYSADPNKDKNATPFDDLSWKDYRKMVGNTWSPGLSAPFDPIASKYCHKNKMQAIIMSGDLLNVSAMIRGKKFTGTVLS